MNAPPPTCPLGRREANRQHRREAILDVAQRSFLDHGYAATTMSAIASALGGSKATLWSYFASKELLFAAVVERATTEFQSRMQALLSPSEDPAQCLAEFAGQFVRRITSPDAIAIYRLVIAESRRFPETGRIFSERAPERTRHILATYLEAAMARGQLRRADATVAARHFMSLCLGGRHQQLLLGAVRPDDVEVIAAEAAEAVETFLHAYRPA